jgi:hypothetical protein
MNRGRSLLYGLALALTALVLTSFAPSHAVAASKDVRVSITAVIETVSDPGQLLEGSIQPGDSISGVYTYGLRVQDTNSSRSVGDYQYASSPYGIRIDAGGYVFQTDPQNVNFLLEVVNNLSGLDNYLLRSYNNSPLSNGVPVGHIAWQLDDPTQAALRSDVLPKSPPNLADWQSIFGLTLEGEDPNTGNFYFVRAHVTEARRIS